MEGATLIRHVSTIDTRRHCRDVPLLKLENSEYSQAGSLWTQWLLLLFVYFLFTSASVGRHHVAILCLSANVEDKELRDLV